MRKILSTMVVFGLLLALRVYTNAEEVNSNKDKISINTEPVFTQWVKNWGGSVNENFQSVEIVEDGYIAVGYSSSADLDDISLAGFTDAVIVKYDKDGNVVWQKNYGGNGRESFESVEVVEDGYIAVGSSDSIDMENVSNNGSPYAIIVKYDKEGNVVWQKNWGGNESDYFESITETKDGYIVVGASYSSNIDGIGNNGKQDAIIVKYDKDGNIVWQKNYGGSNFDVFSSVKEIEDGFIATGYSYSRNFLGIENEDSYDGIVVKFDKDGNIVWQKNYGGSHLDNLISVDATEDGFIATGYSYSSDLEGITNKGSYDGIVVKFDKDGNVKWQKGWGYSAKEYFTSIKTLADGYIVSGYSESIEIDGIGKDGDSKFTQSVILKYDKEGNVVWQKSWGGNSWDVFNSIAATEKEYVAVGHTRSRNIEGITNKGDVDAVIIKYTVNDNLYKDNNQEKIQYECLDKVNYKKTVKYNSYKIGDKIEYNGENYYVIDNSDENTVYLTLLKEKPLTVDEINSSIASSDLDIVVNSVYDDIGGINYYSSKNCNETSKNNCSNHYSTSNIKVVIDNWANNTFKNNELIEMNENKARLITVNELVTKLGYELNSLGTNVYELIITEDVPNWAYDNYYKTWTMTEYTDSNSVVQILESGLATGAPVSDSYSSVRPVIYLNKCVVDGGCIEEKEEMGICGETNNNINDTDQVVDAGNTLSNVSKILLFICVILILCGGIFLVYGYIKSKKELKKYK